MQMNHGRTVQATTEAAIRLYMKYMEEKDYFVNEKNVIEKKMTHILQGNPLR